MTSRLISKALASQAYRAATSEADRLYVAAVVKLFKALVLDRKDFPLPVLTLIRLTVTPFPLWDSLEDRVDPLDGL